MNTIVVRLALVAPVLAGTALLRGAQAASFNVIATLPGSPAIGAVGGTTLYGTTPYGGDGNGTVFTLSAAGTYALLHSFSGTPDGSGADAMLGLDSSGNLYGTAVGGGANNAGTAWKIPASGGFTVLHAFGASGDGAGPLQGPVVTKGGDVFGSTSGGAVSTNGNIFRISQHGTYKVLYDFLSGADGHCPFSGVARGKGGTLYGTTVGYGFGGNPNGSVWKFSSQGGLTTLYVFADGTDGEWPMQAPVLDKAGNIYGTTQYQNGAAFAGAVWKINTSGTFSVLHDFNAATEGSVPNSPLIVGKGGTLYGTTSQGGTGGYGTVYAVASSGAVTVEHAFTDGTDGATPTGNLVQDSNGAIYGGTQSGQVFRILQ